MKTQSSSYRLHCSLLVILCLTVALVPASAQTLYDNGPVNGQVNAWEIDGGYTVSDSFTSATERPSTVTGFMVRNLGNTGRPGSGGWTGSITTRRTAERLSRYGENPINNSRSNIKNNIVVWTQGPYGLERTVSVPVRTG